MMRRLLDGAEKCAFLDLRREELTFTENFMRLLEGGAQRNEAPTSGPMAQRIQGV